MKNYLSFYGSVYYPNGGIDDFIGDFDTKEEAIKAVEEAHLNSPRWESGWGNVWSSRDKVKVYRLCIQR